jgi:hypothetical protein
MWVSAMGEMVTVSHTPTPFGPDIVTDTAAIHAGLGGQPVTLIRRPTVRRARAPLTAAAGALLAAATARSVLRRRQRSEEASA